MTSLGRTLIVAAAAIGVLAAPAYAQQINTGATGTYGQVRLRAGFEPDPHSISVNAGGSYDASAFGENCWGYIDTRASYTLRYRAGDLPLYIYATSDADTTVAVRAPNGDWYCDDDSAGNLNPIVSWETPASGRYQIFVGRFGAQSETAPATLHISEIGGPEQTPGGALPDYSLDPAYNTIDLAAGFLPDPHSVEIAAGGSIDMSATGIPGCVGWVAQAPDYRVNWTAGSGELPLTFHVTAESDTVLVINDAEGNWVCNDDTDGFNPVVMFQGAVSGQYDIWVGTYSEGDLQPSTLHVTELYGMEEE